MLFSFNEEVKQKSHFSVYYLTFTAKLQAQSYFHKMSHASVRGWRPTKQNWSLAITDGQVSDQGYVFISLTKIAHLRRLPA
jgi:hypothetical protein